MHDVLIVGAGFCGLGCAAALAATPGSDFVVLEKGPAPGAFWFGGHEHLSLHSPFHALPHDGGLAEEYPMFKTKHEVQEYCARYATAHGIDRRCRFGERVVNIKHEAATPRSVDGSWRVETSKGVYRARRVVVATGLNCEAYVPEISGMSDCGMTVRHSWEVTECASYAGKRMLVVGSGNSAAEMAIALHRAGAQSIDLLVDQPQHLIRRSSLARFFSLFPWLGLSTADLVHELHRVSFGSEMRAINTAWDELHHSHDRFVRLFSVDLSAFGMDKPPPLGLVELDAQGSPKPPASRIPIFDVDDQRVGEHTAGHSGGLIDLISSAAVRVRRATISRFEPGGVVVLKEKPTSSAEAEANQDPADLAAASAISTDAIAASSGGAYSHETYDGVILATGFRHRLDTILPEESRLMGPPTMAAGRTPRAGSEPQYVPLTDSSSRSTVLPSIHFVGFDYGDSSLSLGPALGYRGYDVGATIAHELYAPSGTPPPHLASLPPDARDRHAGFAPTPRHAITVVAAGIVIGMTMSVLRTRRAGAATAAAAAASPPWRTAHRAVPRAGRARARENAQ